MELEKEAPEQDEINCKENAKEFLNEKTRKYL